MHYRVLLWRFSCRVFDLLFLLPLCIYRCLPNPLTTTFEDGL